MPIIDAGVRVDPNDSTCTEGLEKGYFCKKADGTPFVAAVWPGKAYFADFLRLRCGSGSATNTRP